MPNGIHLWSQTAATNASADASINWAEGQAPSSVNDSARALMARVADYYKDLGGLTTGGTGTAYTVTTNRAFGSAAVMDKSIITIIPNADSGAAPTLAVDGLTARAINYSTGVAIPAGALKLGTAYQLLYVHASTEFILLGALAAQVATVPLSLVDINGGTAETAPAVGDLVGLYDLSATANRKMTLANLFKVIDALTAEAAPADADELALYDASAGTADKVTLSVLAAYVAATTNFKAMTKQYLTSGTAATYTTPSGVKTIIIKMIGGGGGGGAASSNNGNTGGTTTFNSIDAAGGGGGQTSFNNGGAGGTGGSGSAALRLPGSSGCAPQNGADSNVSGSSGGPGIFGMGAGRGSTGTGGSGGANTGGGGAGGAGNNTGGGGGSGEYVEIVIASPSATYIYTVGVGGSGGAAGGNAGGTGGTGVIIVEEYY